MSLVSNEVQMKFSEQTYIDNEPFSGSDQDVDIRLHSFKVVKVRKPHDCMLAQLVGNDHHVIQPGQPALRESAIVDDEWGSCYACLDCMDKFLIEEVGLEPDNETHST